ncbi:hypothetical protein BVI2075_150077 [Burkholderia vietnamiensis]|nr:hypothetical protein BVI2075_150077 [Burkholderia vietnamiensis]
MEQNRSKADRRHRVPEGGPAARVERIARRGPPGPLPYTCRAPDTPRMPPAIVRNRAHLIDVTRPP